MGGSAVLALSYVVACVRLVLRSGAQPCAGGLAPPEQ